MEKLYSPLTDLTTPGVQVSGYEYMKPITKNKLEGDWIEKENNEFMQRRHRRYLHFDKVVESITNEIFKKIIDTNYITSYSFFPLIQRISKSRLYKKDLTTGGKKITSKERPIRYSSHFDALIYSWYSHQLSHYYENIITKEDINSCVIGYRKLDKSNLEFAKEVFDYISKKEESTAIAFDIEGFYDNLDFKILKKAWTNILGKTDLPHDHYAVYKAITNFSYVDHNDLVKNLGFKDKNPKYEDLKVFFDSNLISLIRSMNIIKSNKVAGIPQGAPISCILSNMYMLDFDRSVIKKVQEIGGLYRRYSDDIIVVSSPQQSVELKSFIKDEIKKIKLIIEDSKTEIRFFKKENSRLVCYDEKNKISKLQYLGVDFDGTTFTLRHKGYAKFERRMSKSVKQETKRADKAKRGVSKKMLYEKFTPLGDMNYITYVKRASHTLSSPNILKSVRAGRLFKKIKDKISTTKKKILASA